jgi:SAM-dependent methyltransferase
MTRLGRYYDWLGRFQRLAGLVSRSGDSTLTVHRRLASDRPDVPPHHVVHERLLAALPGLASPRVIDAGCGLGGTTFYLQERLGGRYDGVTLSPTQRARAESAARRRGVSESCHFHLHSFDDDLGAVAREGADLIVAIESLAHSPDPPRTIANLARALRPGGRLAIVDDVPADALSWDDPDFRAFRDGWQTEKLAREATLVRAFSDAGLELVRNEDLTPLVLMREEGSLERRLRLSGALLRVLGRSRLGTLLGALDGGLMLERLYARGVMRYRLMVARKAG